MRVELDPATGRYEVKANIGTLNLFLPTEAEAKATADAICGLIADKVKKDAVLKAINVFKEARKHLGKNHGAQLFSGTGRYTPAEHVILRAPSEILLVYSADGTLREVILGGRSNVKTSGKGRDGDINSHNHPTGLPPSGGDVAATLALPGQTTRIVMRDAATGKGEIYHLNATAGLKDFEIETIKNAFVKIAGYGHNATRESRNRAMKFLLERKLIEGQGDLLTMKVQTTGE